MPQSEPGVMTGRPAHNYAAFAGQAEESDMPRGSAYQGPAEALGLYQELVDHAQVEMKGAKNPYTSLNGHMFSFLDQEGNLALRLPDDAQAEFLDLYDSGPVEQYGAVMRGYVSVPPDLLERISELGEWFGRSREWVSTLKPK